MFGVDTERKEGVVTGWWQEKEEKEGVKRDRDSERGHGWMLVIPCPAAGRLPIGKILQFDYNFFRWPYTTVRKNLKRFDCMVNLLRRGK